MQIPHNRPTSENSNSAQSPQHPSSKQQQVYVRYVQIWISASRIEEWQMWYAVLLQVPRSSSAQSSSSKARRYSTGGENAAKNNSSTTPNNGGHASKQGNSTDSTKENSSVSSRPKTTGSSTPAATAGAGGEPYKTSKSNHLQVRPAMRAKLITYKLSWQWHLTAGKSVLSLVWFMNLPRVIHQVSSGACCPNSAPPTQRR